MAQRSDNSSPFRKESLSRITSPDQLDDYIRVSNPGVWIVLIAAALLLAAGILWACCGSLVNTLPAVMVVEDGTAFCYVSEDDVDEVDAGDAVSVGGVHGEVRAVDHEALSPDSLAAELGDYAAHLIGGSDWMHPVEVAIELEDGTYEAHIATATFAPVSLLLGGAS